MDQKNEAAKMKYSFSGPEIPYAWVCLLLGYLFCRTVPIFLNPLGGLIFILAVYAASGMILVIKRQRPTGTSVAAACVSLVMGLVPVVTESTFLVCLAYLLALLSYCYAMSAVYGNTLEKGCSNCLPMDCFQAALLMPFYSITRIFAALFQGKMKPVLILVGKIVAGILLAAIPAALAAALLSYDDGFSSLMEHIWSIPIEDVLSHLRCILFGVPLAMYLFGLYFSSAQKITWPNMTAETARQGIRNVRMLPRLTAAVAVLPVLFVYAVFFFSQWKYYISGFTGVLPEGFSYAEYAREGFFQLCAVSVINLLLLQAVTLFTRRKGEKSELTVRLICVVLSLFTLILIATAAAKLWLYIGSYGLTHKRIYAMWLMVLIGIVYLIITVGEFLPKLKTIFVSVCVCVVLFAVLSLCNVSRITADYNVDRYLNGSLQSVDVELLEELGDSAVPAMVKLARATENEADPAKQKLHSQLNDILQLRIMLLDRKDRSLFAFTIHGWQAEKALKEYGK